MNLKDIYDHHCTLCPLHQNEGRVCVSGAGNLVNPTILIVGDAPSKEEANQRGTFGDDRGRLLRTTLNEAGIKVAPNGDVFATYLCKCFPNGKIKTTEARTCGDAYLIKEILHFKPKLILALGKNAQLILLRNTSSLTQTHGKLFPASFELDGDVFETQVMPIDHPFAVLSNPAKQKAWEADIRRARGILHNDASPYWEEEKLDRFDFVLIDSIRHFREVARELITNHRGEFLSIDIEASGLDEDMEKDDFEVFTLQFGVVDTRDRAANMTDPVYVLPIQSGQFPCTQDPIWLDSITELLNNFLHPRYFKLVAHNGKYDLKGLRRVGVTETSLEWDTMMLWANLHGEAPMSLKEIAYQVTDLGGYEKKMEDYFKEQKTYDAPPEILVPYSGLDIIITRHLMFDMAEQVLEIIK